MSMGCSVGKENVDINSKWNREGMTNDRTECGEGIRRTPERRAYVVERRAERSCEHKKRRRGEIAKEGISKSKHLVDRREEKWRREGHGKSRGGRSRPRHQVR